jgi:rod shape-determining protein MreD
MSTLLAFPVLGVLMMLQLAVFRNLTILQGSADVVMLAVIAWTLQERVKNGPIWALIGGFAMSLVTKAPFFPFLSGYLIISIFVWILKKRIWQIPMLTMFLSTVLGTFIVQFIIFVVLQLGETALEWKDSINLVMLPSVLLNLMFALPVYLLITDLANWLNPAESEE